MFKIDAQFESTGQSIALLIVYFRILSQKCPRLGFFEKSVLLTLLKIRFVDDFKIVWCP